jgi:multidrug transporter EmrE-like cation transporter
MKPAVLLSLAIASEVVATTALKLSSGFTRLVPLAVTAVGYGASFYLLSLSLRLLPLGLAYAVWSGLGIVLTAGVGIVIWQERLDAARIVGTMLIIAGIAVVSLFSKTAPH